MSKKLKKKSLVGFVGQGYIGKNYADDFEDRGFEVVRYSALSLHQHNRERIGECDVVFIAVPTPTTPNGFDGSIVEGVVKLVGKGKIAVIKSTVLPGTAKKIQKDNKKIIVLNSPEFLSESTAAHDARHPFSNIVGVSSGTVVHMRAAKMVMGILPKAKFSTIVDSTEAELIKYAHNGSGYVQIVFFNAMYDLARRLGLNWNSIEEALLHDPLICNRYAKPVHKSGRGAGGNCFVKDFAALANFYKKNLDDKKGNKVFSSNIEKNIELLLKSGKDHQIVKEVHGKRR